MTPLSPADLLDRESYEAVRDAYRARLLAHKAERRVEIGELVSLAFEDRETVRYQIQEMARIERIDDPKKLAHEVDVYGELLPTSHCLTATLFIQIPELERIRSELDRLLGIDECVSLQIGAGAARASVRARFDERQLEEERISAVHYLRFPLSDAERRSFLASDAEVPTALAIEHANYAHAVPIAGATRESLRRDLRGETPLLLDPERVSLARREDQLIYEDAVLRVVLPARTDRARHARVELRDAGHSLVDCDAASAAALFAKARELAREFAELGFAGRIVAAFDPAEQGAPAALQVVSNDAARSKQPAR